VDASEPVSEEDDAPAAPSAGREGWEDLQSSHDARARFEPEEGSTTLVGAWTKEDEVDGEDEDGLRGPSLVTTHIVTEVDATVEVGRPAVLVIACLGLVALALSFGVHMFTSAAAIGGLLGGIILALAGLSLVRLWLGHWDGLIPGFLGCLAVLALVVMASLPRQGQASTLTMASLAFLLGALATVGLLFLCAFRESCHEYFGT